MLPDYLRRFFGLQNNHLSGDDPVGWSSLAALLEYLEDIANEHEKIYETDVRERLWAFLEARFIQLDKDLSVPTEFGMFSPEGNEGIREAFARNAESLDTIIEIFSLDTDEKRMTTFTNPKLTTPSGKYLDDFFGAP